VNETNQAPPADAPLLPEGVIADALKKFEAAPIFIFKRENYYNQEGLRIEENILISGAFPPDFPRWVAHAVVTVPIPFDKNYRPAPGEKPKEHKQAIFVPVPAVTVEEAYTKAPALLRVEAERFEKHWHENVLGAIAQNIIRKQLTQGIRPG
jgi:hypothetical protein